MPTIILSDDHEIVRRGFRALIQEQIGFTVVGESDNGLETLALVERMKPDILVVDLTLPGLDGLEVTRRVKAQWPSVAVVVLSMHSHESYVVEAFRRGASAYVVKEAGVEDLKKALHAAIQGRRFLSPGLPDVLSELAHARVGAPADPYETLTDREREVLQLIAEGYTSPEIAERLGMRSRTADTHRSKILAKLGRRGLPDLVRYALQRGLIPMRTKSSDGGDERS